MDKAPDAYRTISEVADDLDLQQHVLRFWESRFSQIRPLKRGGGRRYYRPDDVELLKGIRHLLYKEGYTIKGVQRILKEQGVRAVQAFARAGQAEVTFEPAEEAPLAAMPSPAMPTLASFAPPPVNPQPMHIAPQAGPPSFPAEDEPGEDEPDDFIP
ncbi:MAG TPA: MerR family transcriptional regulator, partial [Rhabdaerophilum sp.]|nr:MerR family transcriptional regulator [Rhabdaerophilum sp.]